MTDLQRQILDACEALHRDLIRLGNDVAELAREVRELRQMAEAHAAWRVQRLAERQPPLT